MSCRTVLLVEDNPALLAGVSELLRQNGLTVVPFGDFDSARHYLHYNTPAALVTDVRLGAFNGLHLVMLARQLAPDAATFVYSAFPDPLIQQEAARWGAGYASKDDILGVLLPALLQAVGARAVSGDASPAETA